MEDSHTVVRDGFRRPLLRLRVPLLVLGLPGVVDLEAAVELLPAGSQQLDVCRTEKKNVRQSKETRLIRVLPGTSSEQSTLRFYLWV